MAIRAAAAAPATWMSRKIRRAPARTEAVAALPTMTAATTWSARPILPAIITDIVSQCSSYEIMPTDLPTRGKDLLTREKARSGALRGGKYSDFSRSFQLWTGEVRPAALRATVDRAPFAIPPANFEAYCREISRNGFRSKATGSCRIPRAAAPHDSASCYDTIPSDLPTRAMVSRAFSRSARLCAAVTMVRRRALPSGTVG